MFDPGTLQELKKKKPFGSFRIHLSDARTYEVTNPSLLVVMEPELFLALGRSNRFALISFQNITSVESSTAA